jgi:hypothetical protein
MIKVPTYSRSDASQPIRDILKRTAGKMGMSEATVALVMSHFFEGIEIQMSFGNAVTLTGFGMFASVNWESKAYPGLVHPSPRFFAARGLRQAVGHGLGPTAETSRRVVNFKKGHCIVPKKRDGKAGRTSTMSAMRKLREDIIARSSLYGIDPYDVGS